MTDRTSQEWQQLLDEALKAVDYYQQIARRAADGRLRETESLSRLITRQKETEETLLRRQEILEAVGFAAEQFLRGPHVERAMQRVLERLGKATGVRRTYVFRNGSAKDGTLVTTQIYEWAAPGIKPQLDNPDLRDFSYRDAGFDSWVRDLSAGRMIVGDVDQFPPVIGEFLALQDIKSILVVPIFVDGRWWGFIGFDECRAKRKWNDGEMDALKAAAGILGAAVQQNQDREKIEVASRAKSDFLANMSHEFRTPLHHIIGFTELILGKNFGDLTELQAEYLSDVLASSKHLLSLINDILDLAKVEAGKQELQLSPVNVQALLESSLTMIREKSLKHRIGLVQEADSAPEEIRADERKLKQILFNLLSNAVKFTPDGGAVRIKAELADSAALSRLKDAPVREGAIPARDFLCISVQDTGIGIKQEDLTRLFKPFEQVDSSRSRRYQGTGLGLALSRSFVELHGGAIWAESDGEGKGSTFRFLIPL